ncbi:MAG: sensor histidine kinase [Allorhizobium sp.]
MLGKQEPVREPVSLVDLVGETQALMESELARNGIPFETITAPDLPAISAVRIELQQVLINLITNAIQAMDETPQRQRRIVVEVQPAAGDRVSVSVRDSGPGLSAAILETLFKPFHSSKKTGLGMGLAICRSMLEARGGTLTAGNHPDNGAVFEMIVPIEASDE